METLRPATIRHPETGELAWFNQAHAFCIRASTIGWTRWLLARALFPSCQTKSHDAWFLTENVRWGYLPADTDIAAAVGMVNREDVWRSAATALGVAAAEIPEGTSRGTETFFDGKVFDPANPGAYLDSLAIKAMV